MWMRKANWASSSAASCRFVPADKAREVIYGFTTTLDLTALDVLRKNPRYLTRAKSIDTFFSFGPVIVTADEVPDIDGLEVVTEHNGAICSRDFVRNMKTRPLDLVAFHSNFLHAASGRPHLDRLPERRAHQSRRCGSLAHRRRRRAAARPSAPASASPSGSDNRTPVGTLKVMRTGLKRLILWDYQRGTWQYDVICVLISVSSFLRRASGSAISRAFRWRARSPPCPAMASPCSGSNPN